MSILHGLAALALAAASPLSRMLGEVQRVAITQFVVKFLDRQSNRVTSSGLRGGASAKASLTLAGPGKEQYHRIAEALYDEAVKTVLASGIEVIPHARLSAHPEYAKLAESGKPSLIEDEKFVGYGGWTYSARGLDQHLPIPAEMVSLETLKKSVDNSGGLGAALGLLSAGTAEAEYRLNADPARYESEVLGAARAAFAGFGAALGQRARP